MLSWEEGTPIAIIKGGQKNNCILNLIDDNDNNNGIKNKTQDVLDINFIKKLKRNMSAKQKRKIDDFLRSDDYDYDDDEDLKDIFDQILEEASKRNQKEYVINDEGRIQVLPRFDAVERVYIAGPTGSGKTFYTRCYLEQINKVFPNKEIYLFSDVDHDEEIDQVKNLNRVDLNALKAELKEKDKNEIDPTDFEGSICVFDDIDSLEKKTYKLVAHFRDKLLRKGRHDNIGCVITSHNLTNYADSRVILNECSSITFFIKSSGTDQIKYTLKKYCNMSTEEIKRVMNLPSRWVTVKKVVPRIVFCEKQIYLL